MSVGFTFDSIGSVIYSPMVRAQDCKVYSFDCWGTLINPNKAIWNDVSRLICEVFGVDLPHVEVTRLCKHINEKLDAKTSLTGIEYNQNSRIAAVCEALYVEHSRPQIELFIERFDSYLANNNAILIIEKNIRNDITSLRSEGKCIVLLSNSGFVSGAQTRDLLRASNILDLFDEVYLSDEIGVSKPHAKIYNFVLDDLRMKGYIESAGQMIHIGDNRNLDYLAAIYSDINAVHIESGAKSMHESVNSVVEFNFNETSGIVANNTLFSDVQYSQLKFGVIDQIDVAAELVYQEIAVNRRDFLTSVSAPILAETYRHILPANVILVRKVRERIDKYRQSLGLPITAKLWVERTIDDLGSYSHIRAHIRSESLFDSFRVHKGNGHDASAPLLVIDDIYVSGAFTSMMSKALRRAGFTNVNFAYVASCHKDGLRHSQSIEQVINSASIKSLKDMDSFVAKEGCESIEPTRKYYKLLLTSSDDEIASHLSLASIEFVLRICNDLEYVRSELPKDYAKKLQFITTLIRNVDA